MDIWQYIAMEEIPMPSLYFAHEREVFLRDGIYLAKTDFISLMDHERLERRVVRFRTIGDATCTGAVVSGASSVEEIIVETAAARVTERGGRSDDKRSEAAMEDRKKVGYF
jgi:sulfate adenylyltransferase subunit 2